MFKISDGREYFYQWDLNRQLIVADSTIKEVHYCNRTDDCSLVVDVKDGLADVPNLILQQSFDIRVFAYDGNATRYEQVFKVKPRTKPADYIYTETECWTVDKAVNKAVSEAVTSGDFKGDKGDQGDKGATGLRGNDGDTPHIEIISSNDEQFYTVNYTTTNNEPDKTAIEITDNTKASFLPEDYPAILTPSTAEGEWIYSVNETHIPAGMMRKRLNIRVLNNLDKAVMRLSFKYVSVKLSNGNTLQPYIMMSDVYHESNGMFSADCTLVDEEGNLLGNPYRALEFDKWYTLYVTVNGDADFMFWPVWQDIDDNLTIEAVIKDVELLHHPTMPAYLYAASSNCAPTSLYLAQDGSWQYAYSSFYDGIYSVANTAYNRRLQMRLDDDYQEARFDFMFTKSDFRSEEVCNIAASTTSGGVLPFTIIDSQGNTVSSKAIQLNNWYTVIFSNDTALPKNFCIYPQGYNDGTVSGMLNIEMQIKNCKAYKRLDGNFQADIDLSNYYTKEETDALIPDTSKLLDAKTNGVSTNYYLTGYINQSGGLKGYFPLDPNNGVFSTSDIKTIVRRTDDYQILIPKAPTEDKHAVNKAYVDSLFANIATAEEGSY